MSVNFIPHRKDKTRSVRNIQTVGNPTSEMSFYVYEITRRSISGYLHTRDSRHDTRLLQFQATRLCSELVCQCLGLSGVRVILTSMSNNPSQQEGKEMGQLQCHDE
jgi:hypothetical protein